MRSLFLLLLIPSLLSAAAPVVSNVRAAQRAGTKLIDVTYDLSDSDSTSVFVSIQIYNGGTALPAFSLSGDVGSGVTPGFNKKITWNAGQDWNRQYTTSGSARIIADDLTTAAPNATLAYVPAGFTVGSKGVYSSGTSVFTSGFYMDKTEISKNTWDTVKTWAVANGYTFDNPGVGTAANHPVLGVNWYDVAKWCNARSEMEGLAPIYFTDATRATVYRTGQVILRNTYCNFTANGYRLPTRAEWSKAAWGGSTSGPYPWPSYYGSGAEILDASKGNYTNGQFMHQWDTSAVSALTANYLTTPCGYYNGTQQVNGVPAATPVRDMANGFGLYDMFGNVGEWLWDSYYSGVTATTEYKDDNYKGSDLGLGDSRYYAGGFRPMVSSGAAWDSQDQASPTTSFSLKAYYVIYAGGQVATYYQTSTGWPSNASSGFSPSILGNVGFRTVRGL